MSMQTKKQVLVVDNDDDIRAVLDEELKKLGHDPLTT
jgi:CheY-like chemotaxis protein